MSGRHAIFILTFIAIVLGMFSLIMNHPLSHDEHMYVSAGVLIKNNTLYKDFAYLQMPYLPVLYGAFYKLTGTSYYLLWGRMFTFFFMVLSSVLIFLISYKISNSFFISIASLVLLVCNELIIFIMPFSWNHVMPISFLLLAFYLFIISISKMPINILFLLFSGICIGVAIGTRLTYAVMPVSFFIIALLFPRSLTFKKRIVKIFLPVFAGLTVGLFPIFFLLKKATIDVFLFNNLGYHLTNSMWRTITGYTSGMTILSKMKFGWDIFAYPSNVSLFIAISFLFFNFGAESKYRIVKLKQFFSMETLISILLILFTTVAVFQPTPLWPYYFAVPIPFIIILISCGYNSISNTKRHAVRKLLVCLIIVNSIFGGVRLFSHTYDLANIDGWTGISVHETAEQIRRYIGVIEKGDKVATLSPVYAIEADLPIYNELSTGSFLYRVGDLIPNNKRRTYVGTSQQSLHALFEIDPPKAIFVGFEGDLDLPFIVYAETHDFAKIKGDFKGGILYVRKND